MSIKAGSLNALITSWTPGTPIPRLETIPFADYEDFREQLPEGLEVTDVELIWWTAAAGNSAAELQRVISGVIARQNDWGDFRYHPISDNNGAGRYPQALLLLVLDLLPPGIASAVDEDETYSNGEPLGVAGSIVIQVGIWHQITFELLKMCPREHLPEHLLEHVLGVDLGL
ncbi:hypothetical protein [Pseudomonas graminis]|uniref:Uncharacterized protein n=1 Tax=Pseudomonas graminis TaxID=158627 RepID=A0A1C2EF21_9PSED|nr:hypothetical protein [Pseudomonas graminis]OCX25527.1 hypothetical protein BBI10_02250 [Pseudomonas graminis]